MIAYIRRIYYTKFFYSNYIDIRRSYMAYRIPFSNSTLSSRAKTWLIFYLLIQFILGIGLLYASFIFVPFIFLVLIHIYSIVQLMKSKKQGFYILLGSDIIFLLYTILTKKPMDFFYLAIINFLFLFITWACIQALWKKR